MLVNTLARVADVMSTAQVQGVHLPLKFMLGNRYRHINFKMTEKWDLAAVENIPALFEMGEKHAEKKFDFVNDSYFCHTRSRYKPYTSADNEVNLDESGFE